MLEVHYSVSSRDINSFANHGRPKLICFRCGEPGHMRAQCLTFKVRLCRHHRVGSCTDPYCLYAHGEEELRTPWKVRCVRVVKQNGRLICIGCNSTTHTFRQCPLHEDLIL